MTRKSATAEKPRTIIDDLEFRIYLVRQGKRWHAHISRGIFHLGEPGSGTYVSRTETRTIRKAMKTISRIIAHDHMTDARIQIVRD